VIERSVRRSQTLAPFGVGAVYDILGESLVAADISYWKNRGDVIRASRLERELKVAKFKLAPSHTSLWGRSPGIPYVRFPKWLFCATCRRMVLWRWGMEVEGEPAMCPNCDGRKQLVPMRFVMVCRNGHLADVAWERWAHSRAKTPEQKKCESKDLKFVTKREAGAGLESLIVECRTCEASRPLQGITASGSLKPLGIHCRGTQPWQRADAAEPCTEEPQVVQRGASNLYFGVVRSSIDIPPESAFSAYSDLALSIQSSPEFEVILSSTSGPMAPMLIESLAQRLGCSAGDVEAVVRAEERSRAGEAVAPEIDADDLESEEWQAFLTPRAEHDDRDRFITEQVPLVRPEDDVEALRGLEPYVARVVLATKLREVRALVGFSRYATDGRLITPDLGRGLDWLPAVEVFGEGIFLALAEGRLSQWEQQDSVRQRAAELERRREASFLGARFPRVTPRFVLLHTLAHILIRQLAFECGYASASLRERIYARTADEGEPQAGILIFTAAGDVEGTLGGLARQGEPPRLAQTLLAALQESVWCSSDPICRESKGQGFGSMNLAACHACTLVSETSCVYSNTMLDRRMVVGTPEHADGFFSDPLTRAFELSAETVQA
jgi:Domain of unknown function (DUF1998)